MQWDKGRLKSARILSILGNPCRIRTDLPVEAFVGESRLDIKHTGEKLIEFITEANTVYEIKAGQQK